MGEIKLKGKKETKGNERKGEKETKRKRKRKKRGEGNERMK